MMDVGGDCMSRVTMAAFEYLGRSSRKRWPASDGRPILDGWYPAEHERRECCSLIQTSDWRRRWRLYKHCSSKKHVAKLFGVTLKELNDAIKFIKATADREVLF